MEAEQEEENAAKKTQENTEVYLMSSALPTTPRQELVQSLLRGGSSSGILNSQYLRKSGISLTEKSAAEDGAEEMPEILSHSPIDNIKSVSPNGKRVSPPHEKKWRAEPDTAIVSVSENSLNLFQGER